jgi:hypothetical protein
MSRKQTDEQYSDEEITQRRDEALLRALNTPPKPHSEMKVGKVKAMPRPKSHKPKKKA